MFIAVVAYQIAYRGMGAAAANDCSQNRTQQIVFVLHYILYMSCDLQIMANLQKKIQNASLYLPQTYPYAFVRAYLYPWLDVHRIFNGGTSDSKLSPYLYCPRQYHVCVLLQWCTLHGISVLLYVESTFCSAIINYHSSRPAFLPPKSPKKHLCQREKSVGATENPPSRNRKSRFASP